MTSVIFSIERPCCATPPSAIARSTPAAPASGPEVLDLPATRDDAARVAERRPRSRVLRVSVPSSCLSQTLGMVDASFASTASCRDASRSHCSPALAGRLHSLLDLHEVLLERGSAVVPPVLELLRRLAEPVPAVRVSDVALERGGAVLRLLELDDDLLERAVELVEHAVLDEHVGHWRLLRWGRGRVRHERGRTRRRLGRRGPRCRRASSRREGRALPPRARVSDRRAAGRGPGWPASCRGGPRPSRRCRRRPT